MEKRAMVQVKIRDLEEEQRKANLMELGTQGAWTWWDLLKRKVTWDDLWRLLA